MKRTILFIFISIFILKTTQTYSQLNTQDSLALVDFYDSTGGASWHTPWIFTNAAASWFGITLSSDGTRVTEINLAQNNLTGNIPSTIGNLTSLTNLGLQGNQLTGISSSITNCTSLKFLILNSNKFDGQIPAFFTQMNWLYQLDLSNNLFSGNIPASFINMTGLAFLDMSFNNLSGSIPASIGYLRNLEGLNISNNQLSDTIPDSWSAGNMQNIDLSNNNLTGNIPSSFNNIDFAAISIGINKLNFDKMEGLVKAMKFTLGKFYPSPQGNISLHFSNDIFSVYAGGTLRNNTYQWYKNGVLDTTIKSDSTFAIAATDNNKYSVAVSNSIVTKATQLVLYSDTISLAQYIPTITTLPQNLKNLCPGTPVTLISSLASGNLWSTGAQTQSIIVDTAGAYSVMVSANGISLSSAVTNVAYKSCTKPKLTGVAKITSSTATVYWSKEPCKTEYTLEYRKTGTSTFTTVTANDTLHKISGLLPSTNYQWKVRTVCVDTPLTASDYTTFATFTTTSAFATDEMFNKENSFSIIPNPAHYFITVSFIGENENTIMQIINSAGESIIQKQMTSFNGKNTMQINVSKLSAGVYALLIETKKGVQSKLFVKE